MVTLPFLVSEGSEGLFPIIENLVVPNLSWLADSVSFCLPTLRFVEKSASAVSDVENMS